MTDRLWDNFCKSGRIEDYLQYKQKLETAAAGDYNENNGAGSRDLGDPDGRGGQSHNDTDG
ncbi:MAG: hypothetical protein VB092_09605 [Oscillospiraceae bacterium]|nr:hypothetical protein [Oscillospiraceae bacterium]